MHILAATDFSTRSNRALRQAGLLAQPNKAQLTIVHVVDDDQPDAMVRIEKQEAERTLAEQIAAMPELQGVEARPIVVTGDPFDGILKTAAQLKPTLIVMGPHRKQILLDIFVGTTIERVIRKGSFPVLMVNHEAQRRYTNVIAPTDLSKASAHSFRVAIATGLISDCRATLLHAFLAPGKGKLFGAGLDKAAIDDYVGSERQNATDDVVRFLVANELDREKWSLWIEEGGPMEVITKVVEESRPDLLVMGTHGRSGLAKALIGSVTEQALRSLNVDILAVPPPAR